MILRNTNNQHKKGATLIYVILLMCLTTILGAGVLSLSDNSIKNTAQEIYNQQAYLTAKSGLNLIIDIFEDSNNKSKTDEIAKNLVNVNVISNNNQIDERNQFDSYLTCAKNQSDEKVVVDGMCKLINLEVIGKYDDTTATLSAQIELNKQAGGSGFSAPYVYIDSIQGDNKDVYWFDFTKEEASREHCGPNEAWCQNLLPEKIDKETDKSQKITANNIYDVNGNIKSNVIDNIKQFINDQTLSTNSTRNFIDVHDNYTNSNSAEYRNKYYCENDWLQFNTNCVYRFKVTQAIANDSSTEDLFLFMPADKDGILNLDKMNIAYNYNDKTRGNHIYLVTNAKQIHITDNTTVISSLFNFDVKNNIYAPSQSQNLDVCQGNGKDGINYDECLYQMSQFGAEYNITLINLYEGASDIYISGSIKDGKNIFQSHNKTASMWIFSPNSTVYYGYELSNENPVAASTNQFSGGIIARNIVVDENSVIFGVGHHFKESSDADANLGSDLYKLLGSIGINVDVDSNSHNSWSGKFN